MLLMVTCSWKPLQGNNLSTDIQDHASRQGSYTTKHSDKRSTKVTKRDIWLQVACTLPTRLLSSSFCLNFYQSLQPRHTPIVTSETHEYSTFDNTLFTSSHHILCYCLCIRSNHVSIYGPIMPRVAHIYATLGSSIHTTRIYSGVEASALHRYQGLQSLCAGMLQVNNHHPLCFMPSRVIGTSC